MIKAKRVYAGRADDDGFRILVDRLWPRGIRKSEASVDLWLKGIAPSDELRKWFTHDPKKWDEFKRRYFDELGPKNDLVELIMQKSKEGNVTLLYGAKNERFNNAMALVEYIQKVKKPL